AVAALMNDPALRVHPAAAREVCSPAFRRWRRRRGSASTRSMPCRNGRSITGARRLRRFTFPPRCCHSTPEGSPPRRGMNAALLHSAEAGTNAVLWHSAIGCDRKSGAAAHALQDAIAWFRSLEFKSQIANRKSQITFFLSVLLFLASPPFADAYVLLQPVTR